MTCERTGYFSDMNDAPARVPHPRRPAQLCSRCPRPSDVVVQDERGLVISACVDHLEWAFLTGVDAWTGRWRTA